MPPDPRPLHYPLCGALTTSSTDLATAAFSSQSLSIAAFLSARLLDSLQREAESLHEERVIRDRCRHEDPVLCVRIAAEHVQWRDVRRDRNLRPRHETERVPQSVLDERPGKLYGISIRMSGQDPGHVRGAVPPSPIWNREVCTELVPPDVLECPVPLATEVVSGFPEKRPADQT